MQDLVLQHVFIYPIKSLGGISLNQSEVEAKGLKHDRRWMLTDKGGQFLSQRKFPQMALLQVNLLSDGLTVNHKRGTLEPLKILFSSTTGKKLSVTIWDDDCTALEVGVEADNWFTQALGMPTQLVHMPETTKRLVDPNYATNNEIVSFADGYPMLLIGQSSLDDLNERLDTPVPMNRFRPNLVFSGGLPFCEDDFGEFKIGNVAFKAVKPCARCILTTINQEDGQKGAEPLKTLATYRSRNNKILFGQNLLPLGAGMIKTGDKFQFL
jgi:uncharacterized protein YcbX